MPIGPRTRVLLIAAVVFAALAALIWYLSVAYWAQPVTPLAPPTQGAAQEAATPAPTQGATATPPAATPTPNASPAPSASPQAQGAASDPASALASMRLLIPVAGVRAQELHDTFSDSRSEGRVHDAIDIVAPRNAPVLAAVDGRVVRLFQNVKGGITIYQLASADEHFVFYYAHLAAYADGLAEGHLARRGETIGYVGDTGNVTPGNTHLHFQIYRVADPKRFWSGENINPYPLLRNDER
ncbi:MAG TPA: peptidoglycan DD-metalloendopeptidase family protein [Pyrinomonadaceae bacterium]|nr:peptidoglycan DD-metalloendopeptidase family protein [Pyrinomonadaceae bacterium]